MANWMVHIMDVKGALLNRKFHNGEDLYLKLPEGMQCVTKNDEVLKLHKMS